MRISFCFELGYYNNKLISLVVIKYLITLLVFFVGEEVEHQLNPRGMSLGYLFGYFLTV
jgi:hypothetical protein